MKVTGESLDSPNEIKDETNPANCWAENSDFVVRKGVSGRGTSQGNQLS